MLLVMVVALYTSRIVLGALGVVEYGIYNVVGGLSSAFIFFATSLTNSTQRFLNYEMGRGDKKKVAEVFNISILIFGTIAILVFAIGTPIGLWAVNNRLVIPAEHLHAAQIVLYTIMFSLCVTFVSSVYEAVLIAHENMRLYAYVGLFDAILKLGFAYTIVHVSNKLIIYAWLMFVALVIPKLLMAIYCIFKYPEARFHFFWNRKMFKEIFGFSGWSIYGSAVWMINEQGVNIVLNMFFGPVVNAARGIAAQVNNAVNNFSTNFFVAVRPQIVKRFAAQDHESMKKLIFSSSRFSVYLLWIISAPLIIRADYILHLWLKDVPEFATVFVQWILIYSLVNSLNNPVWTAVMATGQLKKVVLVGSNLFLLAFPANYLALKLNASPLIVYPILAIGRLLFLFVALNDLGKSIKITITEYFKTVLIPITCVCTLSFVVDYIFNGILSDTFFGFILFAVVSALCSITLIWLVGIDQEEKLTIKNFIIDKIKK